MWIPHCGKKMAPQPRLFRMSENSLASINGTAALRRAGSGLPSLPSFGGGRLRRRKRLQAALSPALQHIGDCRGQRRCPSAAAPIRSGLSAQAHHAFALDPRLNATTRSPRVQLGDTVACRRGVAMNELGALDQGRRRPLAADGRSRVMERVELASRRRDGQPTCGICSAIRAAHAVAAAPARPGFGGHAPLPCRQRPQQAPEWCMEVRVWGMSWQGSILCQVWDVKIVGRRRLQLPLPSSWIRRSAPAPAAGAYWPNGRGVKIPHPSSIFPRYVLKYGSAATLPACAQSWLLLPMRT